MKGFFEEPFNKECDYDIFKDLSFILRAYGIYIKYQNGKIILDREEEKKLKKLFAGEIYKYPAKYDRVILKKYIGENDVYTLSVPIFNNYLVNGAIHHNSGKDTISALIQLYIVYLLLHMKNPQAYFNLGPGSSIDLINIASTKEQAEQVYFQLLKNLILNWKWLRSKYGFLISGRYYSTPSNNILDTNKVTITTEGVIFPKNIRMFSGSSEAESSEGKNLLVFVLDEADAFKSTSGARSAKHVFDVCRTSAVSRFQNRYKGFILSYPRSKDGFILSLYNSVQDSLQYYCDKAATWEVLPPEKFCGETFEFEGHKIPIEFYEDFKLDPVTAKLMFMCETEGNRDAFFNMTEIQHAFQDIKRANFIFKDYEEKNGDEYLCKKDILYVPYQDLDPGFKYVLSFDLAIKKDKCALSLGHMDKDKIVIDFVTAWVPDEKIGKKVDLENVYNIIEKICEMVKPVEIMGDFWNSGLLIQRLKAKGYNAKAKKVTYEDLLLFKRLLLNGSLFLPNNPDLITEMKELVVKGDKVVDHPDSGHNDLFMSVVYIIKSLLNTDGIGSGVNLSAEGEFIGNNLTNSDFGSDVDESGISLENNMDGIILTKGMIYTPPYFGKKIPF